MSAAPIERVDTFEDIVADLERPCEHSQHANDPAWHDGPAWAVVQVLPDPCGCEGEPVGIRLLVCRRVWEISGAFGFTCRNGHRMTREQGWRFIELVRP